MATEIKECPFCGKQPELIRRGNEHTKRSAEIICKNCGVIIKVAAIRNNLQWCVDTVIAKWNKRQPPPVEVEQGKCESCGKPKPSNAYLKCPDCYGDF